MTDNAQADLAKLVPIIFGHAAFQQLNAGFALGLFELLDRRGRATSDEICEELGLGRRSVEILLLGNTALGLTRRVGGSYSNGSEISEIYRSESAEIFRDIVEFQASIAYIPASEYVESLRTGTNAGIRHFDGETEDLYSRLGNTPGLEELFYRGMNAWSCLSNPVLLRGVDYSGVRKILDVGGGDATNAIALVREHPHLEITVMDREGALVSAIQNIAASGLGDRISVATGDIFDSEYPTGHDCVLFAHQLVIWSPDQNRQLLGKARAALDDGGRVLIFNAFSNDGRDGPLYAALDSVYFTTLPFEHSTLYPWCDYEHWLNQERFHCIRRSTLESWTPHGVIEATAMPSGVQSPAGI